MSAPSGLSDTPDANAVPVYPMPPAHGNRPTFHVSREMVCFLGGIGVALGIMYICTHFGGGRRKD